MAGLGGSLRSRVAAPERSHPQAFGTAKCLDPRRCERAAAHLRYTKRPTERRPHGFSFGGADWTAPIKDANAILPGRSRVATGSATSSHKADLDGLAAGVLPRTHLLPDVPRGKPPAAPA